MGKSLIMHSETSHHIGTKFVEMIEQMPYLFELRHPKRRPNFERVRYLNILMCFCLEDKI